MDYSKDYNDLKIETVCPSCGNDEIVWRNSSDEIQCDNCGFEEN